MVKTAPDKANCTVPYFGFKAKLIVDSLPFPADCTVPYFGFKAKRTEITGPSR